MWKRKKEEEAVFLSKALSLDFLPYHNNQRVGCAVALSTLNKGRGVDYVGSGRQGRGKTSGAGQRIRSCSNRRCRLGCVCGVGV